MTADTRHEHTAVVVLLGASNLTLAWPRIIFGLESRVPCPRSVITAHGMGRSYINHRSSFGFRQLPGILNSRLWERLTTVPCTSPPLVLITDLGNDWVFGKSPEEVADSAMECVRRIREFSPDAQIVMTRPPVESVSSLGKLRFLFFRSVIFPKSRLTLANVKAHTLELDERLVEHADQLSIPLHQPNPDWYGVDPIHIRHRHQYEAFGAMMDLWSTNWTDTQKRQRPTGTRHPRPTPEQRWVFGREKEATQPAVHMNGTTVFAY